MEVFAFIRISYMLITFSGGCLHSSMHTVLSILWVIVWEILTVQTASLCKCIAYFSTLHHTYLNVGIIGSH